MLHCQYLFTSCYILLCFAKIISTIQRIVIYYSTIKIIKTIHICNFLFVLAKFLFKP